MPQVLSFKQNTKGRDFVVGDIHGGFDTLERALKKAKFDKRKDRLFSVGDLINRGPYSKKAKNYLQKHWFFAVKGNHEDILIKNIGENGEWLSKKTTNPNDPQYGWAVGMHNKDRKKLAKKLNALPYAIEIETKEGKIGIVHGDVLGNSWPGFVKKLEKDDQDSVRAALNGRARIRSDVGGKVKDVFRVFSGHSYAEGAIQKRGNCYFIDTGHCVNYTDPEAGCVKAMSLVQLTAPEKEILKLIPQDVRIHIVEQKTLPRYDCLVA